MHRYEAKTNKKVKNDFEKEFFKVMNNSELRKDYTEYFEWQRYLDDF